MVAQNFDHSKYSKCHRIYVFVYVVLFMPILLFWLGPPGRPKGPLDVEDVKKDSCLLKWKPPEDDGGNEIT